MSEQRNNLNETDKITAEVDAGLIRDGERILICQRPANKARGLLWEFPGGKVEAGESKQEALVRECREELDVTLTVGSVYAELTHEYPDITVKLTLFEACIAEGVPRRIEHADIRWVYPAEITTYPFCPADKEICLRLSLENIKKV